MKALVSKTKLDEIVDSYSADRIAERQMRKPFKYLGKAFITIGCIHRNGISECWAYQVIPERVLNGESFWYGECPDEFTYHGMKAKNGKETFILQGPMVEFRLDPESKEPQQMGLF